MARAQEGCSDPHPGLWLAPVRAHSPRTSVVGCRAAPSPQHPWRWSLCQDPTLALAGLQQWAGLSGQGVFLGEDLRGGSAWSPLPRALSELKAWAGGPWGF